MPPYSTINLHPKSHSISSLKSQTFDVICIGSGWAGRTLAAKVVKAGLSAIIVEKELVGGDCPFWACVPSKALLRPQQVLDEARAVTGVKELLPQQSDTQKSEYAQRVFARRDAFTAQWDDSALLIPMVQGSGASLVRGKGKLTGVKTVLVEGVDGDQVELKARHAVAVCTGSEPVIPDIPGLAQIDYWTPREAVSSSEVPSCLVVLGAGVVGCELASAYNSFGTKVTLLSHSAEVLPKIDQEAGELVRKALAANGVDVRLSSSAKSISKAQSGAIRVELSNGETIRCSHFLVAAGRKAAISRLGLEMFGITDNEKIVAVDESLLVTNVQDSWLYAVGDINGRAPLTHSCKYHGTVAANAIVARANSVPVQLADWDSTSATADHYAIPQVIFTSPEVASVGFTRRAAKAAGKSFQEYTAPVWTVGASIWKEGYEQGWAQWIVDKHTGVLIGATIVGEGATELIHPSTVAIVAGMTLGRLAHAIPCFPTMSEVYLNLMQAAGF